MPISREEFEEGTIDLTIHILGLLESTGDEALNLGEITAALRRKFMVPITDDVVLTALLVLDAESKIETKVVGETGYYILKRR